MFRFSKLFTAGLLVPLIIAGLGLVGAFPALAAPTAYYIDCAAGNDANNGTSTSTPWKTFANVNGRVFNAGDSLLLKRGVTCSGIGGLAPKGSGTSTSPITLGDYGTGTLPWIQAGANNAVYLNDQAGWVIQNLHVSSQLGGGQSAGFSGLFIDSHVTTQSYFRILGVESSGNWFGLHIGLYKPKNSVDNGTLDDMIIDGVNTHDNDGAGIEISGNWKGNATGTTDPPFNTNITVRNTLSHDNGRDGILIAATNGGLAEHNTVYHNGLSENDRYGIWPWDARNVTVQFNEVYNMQSNSTKGAGGLDCDWHDMNCVMQYNYTHDDQGPGILLIGDGSESLDGCTVRYNIFERESLSLNQNGVILPFGSVKNCKVYNNTVYFNNTTNTVTGNGGSYALLAWTWGGFGNGSNNTISNNIFYLAPTAGYPLSARGARIETGEIGSGIVYDHNLWYSTDGNIRYDYGGTIYSTVSAA